MNTPADPLAIRVVHRHMIAVRVAREYMSRSEGLVRVDHQDDDDEAQAVEDVQDRIVEGDDGWRAMAHRWAGQEYRAPLRRPFFTTNPATKSTW